MRNEDSGFHLEVAVFETAATGEVVRTVGRTGDRTAVAAALAGIAREVAAMCGEYPQRGAQVRALHGVSDAE